MDQSKNIKLLPEHLIDQIKAGEVIEKPASLLKELVENSLDADSTKIDIHIIDNGLELISIEDNGNGIYMQDLPYAFCRHATSKIERFEDIYNLFSFGFRGEALASIAAISRLTCSSTPKEDPSKGGKIVFHGGMEKAHTPYQSHSHGTSIFIKDLFYNTPARLKFIKSKVSEKNSIKRITSAFILSNPNTAFTLKWDNKEKQFFPPISDDQSSKRISQILFSKKAEDKELIYFQSEYEGYKIEGHASRFCSRGNAGKNQYLFVNNRLFTDRAIHQAILRSMEGVWFGGMTGHYCIRLQVPPAQVDVNVHPSKTQVKFFKPSVVYSLVSAGIKKTVSEYRSIQEASGQVDQTPQSNIFGEEQNQKMSLDSFNNSPFSNNSSESFSFNTGGQGSYQGAGKYTESNRSTDTDQVSRDFQMLTSKFAMIRLEGRNEYFLLDTHILVGSYWIENLMATFPIPDNDLTPLLISEPFSLKEGNIDRHLEFLKKVGLELDRLEDDIIVLRTIPHFLGSFPIKETIGPLLESFNESKKVYTEANWQEEFENLILGEIDLSQLLLSQFQYQDLMKKYSTSILLESRILAPLNNSNLNKVFKGE